MQQENSSTHASCQCERRHHHLRNGLFLCREFDAHMRNAWHGGGQSVQSQVTDEASSMICHLSRRVCTTTRWRRSRSKRRVPCKYARVRTPFLTSLTLFDNVLVNWTTNTWDESDDFVRPWSVSAPLTTVSPATFSLTIRSIEHGLITPILHRLAHKVDPNREGKAIDISSLRIVARLRSVGVELFRFQSPLQNALVFWIARGIGLAPSPFLGLTRHVVGLAWRTHGVWDVALVISSHEPEVMLFLVQTTAWAIMVAMIVLRSFEVFDSSSHRS